MVYTFLDTGVLDELMVVPGYSELEQAKRVKKSSGYGFIREKD